MDFEKIPELPQRQDSLVDQLEDLIAVANRLGMYDAADWVKTRLKTTKAVIEHALAGRSQ